MSTGVCVCGLGWGVDASDLCAGELRRSGAPRSRPNSPRPAPTARHTSVTFWSLSADASAAAVCTTATDDGALALALAAESSDRDADDAVDRGVVGGVGRDTCVLSLLPAASTVAIDSSAKISSCTRRTGVILGGPRRGTVLLFALMIRAVLRCLPLLSLSLSSALQLSRYHVFSVTS